MDHAFQLPAPESDDILGSLWTNVVESKTNVHLASTCNMNNIMLSLGINVCSQ
jgi:hypothetical protein